MPEPHEDSEFFGIKAQQSAYELEHFDKRDQLLLTQFSILSQQCILLRSRISSEQREKAEIRSHIARLEARLAPLEALHQKLTSIWAVVAALAALCVGILELIKLLKGLFGK